MFTHRTQDDLPRDQVQHSIWSDDLCVILAQPVVKDSPLDVIQTDLLTTFVDYINEQAALDEEED